MNRKEQIKKQNSSTIEINKQTNGVVICFDSFPSCRRFTCEPYQCYRLTKLDVLKLYCISNDLNRQPKGTRKNRRRGNEITDHDKTNRFYVPLGMQKTLRNIPGSRNLAMEFGRVLTTGQNVHVTSKNRNIPLRVLPSEYNIIV